MNNLLTFSIGVIATLVLSWLAFIVGARSQFGDLQPTAENEDLVGSGAELFPKKMSGMASQGAEEYVSLGCISCHTQQVRLVAHMDKKLKDFVIEPGFDIKRGWGKRPSVARDYILRDQVLLGNTRIGPDLANFGLRGHADEWLHQHLFEPQSIESESICPPSPFLYEVHDKEVPGSIKVSHPNDENADHVNQSHDEPRYVSPKLRARKIVAYLQSLKQDYELPEMAFVKMNSNTPVSASLASTTKSARTGNQATSDDASEDRLARQIAAGKEVYMKVGAGGGMCFTCHQVTGEGLALAHYPPLANSEWVLGEKEPLIKIMMHGLSGPIKVKGKDYGLVFMPAPGIPPGSLSDENIANVLTYIRNEWGNSASAVSVDEVAAIRDEVEDRPSIQMWTAAELKGGE